jgi:hypothetical protein
MALELYGITSAKVLDELPNNIRGVTSSSQGLNTTKITAWIERAAGQVNALLERYGVTSDEVLLNDNSLEVARTAILSYAVAKSLEVAVANPADPRIERSWAQWRDAYKLLQDVPSTLGAALEPTDQVKANFTPGQRKSYTFRNTKW